MRSYHLTPNDIKYILHTGRLYSSQQLAKRFKCCTQTIRDIWVFNDVMEYYAARWDWHRWKGYDPIEEKRKIKMPSGVARYVMPQEYATEMNMRPEMENIPGGVLPPLKVLEVSV